MGHAKAAKAYKAKVASLTSERADLRTRVQSLTEEAVKLKSDLRHTVKTDLYIYIYDNMAKRMNVVNTQKIDLK